MAQAFICDYVRTPVGCFGGVLSCVRVDELASVPLAALTARNKTVDWAAVDDVITGCASQTGESSRNIARLALLLAGLPVEVSGTTVNRLSGSGMEAVMAAARAIKAGEAELIIAGGVDSMSRAALLLPEADIIFPRSEKHDISLASRFLNPKIRQMYGDFISSVTADKVALHYHIPRADQDGFAVRSQIKAAVAQTTGRLLKETVSVTVRQKGGGDHVIVKDEMPHPVSQDFLSGLKPVNSCEGATVTEGNSAALSDGACALLIASEHAVEKYALTPLVRITGAVAAGASLRAGGAGSAGAAKKLLKRLGWNPTELDLLEINEEFASQALATLRVMGIADDDLRVNPNGGAIAMGHSPGMSGARLVGTAALELSLMAGKLALAATETDDGQGIAVGLERV
ncbi:acetyl-CoA C-acyltransferase [Acetobacter thailandicus]|uniref:acetyl-CoA C-acyltransferase n=1 Tax=Acetobacter thailandicus TaxID=1502842 RepID=UPI001BA68687|nr:acetyl-CoA C-acyltransferase [Acetobacter thailandicus]MBS0980357.1 acetyl-CoA C-acyltransferase [Acetobacter thailandicus]